MLLFNPSDSTAQLLLGVVIMAMTLSSAFSVSYHTPAMQLAITLLLAPVIVMGMIFGAPPMVALAVLGIGLLVMVWKLVAERSRQLEENIGLRHNESTLREQALAGLRESQQVQAERLRFFSAANHDLRQPVMAMGLQAEVLRQQLAGGEDMATVQKTVASLSRAQQALEGLTNQLLEIGRIEAAADPLVPTAVALAPLLHDIARQDGSGRVRVRCPRTAQRPRPMPSPCGASSPTWSTTRSSSRRAGACCWRAGGAATAGASKCATAASASRADAQERVFGDFEQVATSSATCSAATDWGWRSCGRACDPARRAGHAAFDARAGLGVRLVLPAAPAGCGRGARRTRGSQAPPPRRGIRLAPGLAVLVVEDNAVVADSIAALLRLWGAQPRVYGSAAEALALADLPAIDVALCDIRPAGQLDGIGLAAGFSGSGRSCRSRWSPPTSTTRRSNWRASAAGGRCVNRCSRAPLLALLQRAQN